MKASEAFPSNWLKATDIDAEVGAILTIAGYEMKDIGTEDDKERKPVLSFEEVDKELVLNRTNNNTLIGLFGDETDDWIGRKVKLAVVDASYRGKVGPAIRISTQKVATRATVATMRSEMSTQDAKWEADPAPKK